MTLKQSDAVATSSRSALTSRQRLLNVIHGRPVDRPAWTTLVDDVTRSLMPADVRAMHVLDFYRRIGCDILLFGNYGLPAEDQVPAPSRLVIPHIDRRDVEGPDGRRTSTRTFGRRSLVMKQENAHPVKYPVESLEDLRLLRDIWYASRYEADPTMEPGYARMQERLGDDGLFVPTLDPSPVQYLLEYEMGPANFYWLLQDYPQDMQELLAVMHARRIQEYQLLAARTPSDVVIPVENTSSTLISPELYRTYSLPQIRDYADILHARGKKMVLHMCGHLKSLLPVIRETGLDGINAVTPPPVGTTTFEDVWDAYGDDFLILGGVPQPTLIHDQQATPAQIHAYLDALYTPRVRRANLLLWLAVDGLPTPLKRFLAFRDWFNR